MALKEQQYQILQARDTRAQGTSFVDYSRAPCLGADQKARGLWERDWPNTNNIRLLTKCDPALLSFRYTSNRLHLVWSFGWNSDCYKLGHSSCPVVGTEIQTSCNFNANLCDRYFLLDCVYCRFSNTILESPSNIVVCLISLCLVISTYSYTKILFILHHRQSQIQDNVQQPNQTNQLNIGRYKKAVSTAIWLQLTLVVCYLPC